MPSMLLVLLLRAGLLPRVLMYVLSIQVLKHSKNQDSFQKLMEELEKEGSQRQRYLGSTEAPASAQRSTDCGNQWKRVRCWILLLMTAWRSRYFYKKASSCLKESGCREHNGAKGKEVLMKLESKYDEGRVL